MNEQELKDLIESMRRDKEEMNEKINSLSDELRKEKESKEHDILMTKINSLEKDFKDESYSVEFLRGYLQSSEQYSEKINAITIELAKVNGGSQSTLVPPTNQPNQERMIRTPFGLKKESEIDASILAIKHSNKQEQEVK